MPRSPLIAVPAVDPALLARVRARVAPAKDQPKAEAPSVAIAGSTATIRLYDAIDSYGWWGISAAEFVQVLDELPSNVTEIRLHINSPGGDVFDGVTIANALRAHPARVVAIVDGLAASIASVIALSGDELLMCENTSYMVHDASGLCWGNADDMQAMKDLLDHVSNNIAGAYARKAGDTADYWRAVMKAETWYSADEAVAAGLADRVVEPEDAAVAARAQKYDLSAFRFAGRAAAPPPSAQRQSRPAARASTTKGARMGRNEGARIAGAVPAHETEVVARAWDAARVVAALPDEPRGSQLRSVFAYVDPDGDPELAASYAFPHHHGVDAAANLRACIAGIAKLNGAAGGPGVPDEDRQEVYDHLAQHVRDGGMEPTDLRDLHDGAAHVEPFAARMARVLAEVAALNDSATEMVSRAGEGRRPMSKRKTEFLDWIGDELDRLRALCQTPLPDDGPSADAQRSALLAGLDRLNSSGDLA